MAPNLKAGIFVWTKNENSPKTRTSLKPEDFVKSFQNNKYKLHTFNFD